MEKDEKIRCIVLVFTRLMECLEPSFRFPSGGSGIRYVCKCIDMLEKEYTCLSRERVVDFCVTQVFAVSKYAKKYIRNHWNPSHSFGNKALERFRGDRKFQRYYEDKWLEDVKLSRVGLLRLIVDKKVHPLEKFIFPQHEEVTKMRAQEVEFGFYVCCISTLLWTPFSPTCRNCTHVESCKKKTAEVYTELYRLRIEKFGRNGNK